MSTSFTWFGWCSASQIFLFLMQDQESRQAAHQHGSPSTPVLMSSAIETDPWYCVADEARKAGQSCIHTWPVCVSTAQSETHHPSLYPGPIYHLADEGPTWITLNRRHKCTQTHHWEVSKCSKGTSYKPNIQCRFVSATVICEWAHKQLIRQYLAGVLAALLVSSADHVIQDVHLLIRVHPVHLLTWTLGDDWHLHFLQSSDSWQRDWRQHEGRGWRAKRQIKQVLFVSEEFNRS